MRLYKDFQNLQKDLNESRSGVRRSYHLTRSQTKLHIEKRLLRSPFSEQPAGKQLRSSTDFPSNISVVNIVQIPTFDTIVSDACTKKSFALSESEINPKPAAARRFLPFSKDASQDIHVSSSSLVGEIEVHV